MKNILYYSSLLMLLVLASCKDEAEKPKLRYDTANKQKTVSRIDPDQIAIADLPIQIEGTNYLIHPIGDLRVYENGAKSSYGSSSVIDLSFTVSNYADGEITGYLQNIKFQKIDSDSLQSLTDKPVLIQTASYLKGVASGSKKQIMVYTLFDIDTNRDGKLDSSDIKSLYLSDISGERFTKISANFHELIDWSVIDSKNRLYFRTVEDTNKNGKFDKNDVVHYNYVNLTNSKWEVSNYMPI